MTRSRYDTPIIRKIESARDMHESGEPMDLIAMKTGLSPYLLDLAVNSDAIAKAVKEDGIMLQAEANKKRK